MEEEEHTNENHIQMSKEFLDKIRDQHCLCCSMLQTLFCLKGDENKKMQNIDNSIVDSTKEYLESFNKYGLNQSNREEVYKSVYKILPLYDEKKKGNPENGIFTNLEQTLLIDLAPSTADEAFHLIPSLEKKLDSDKMNEYLKKLNKEIKNIS